MTKLGIMNKVVLACIILNLSNCRDKDLDTNFSYLPAFNLNPNFYPSCSAANNDMTLRKKRSDIRQQAMSNRIVARASANTSADNQSSAWYSEKLQSSGSYNNLQIDGVDEGDEIIRTSDKILQIIDNELVIVAINDLSIITKIKLPKLNPTVQPYSKDNDIAAIMLIENYFKKMFINENKLIIVNSTHLLIYNISDINNPSLVLNKSLNSSPLAARLSDGKLILVTNEYSDNPHSNDKRIAPCEKILEPVADDYNPSLVNILRMDLSTLKDDSMAISGTSDIVFMTKSNLYVVKNQYSDAVILEDQNGNVHSPFDHSIVYKISLEDDFKRESIKVGMVEGVIKDSWSLYEHGDKSQYISVVTNSGRWSSNTNYLHILTTEDKKLTKTAKSLTYAPGEEIKASRFRDNIAYVVTFVQVDPLFAFDISNPKEPKLLGELKVPGFSTYLHPVSETQLLGVGYDTLEDSPWAQRNGIKVSLFDVSNPAAMSEQDSLTFGNESSDTLVNSDHLAFAYDTDSKIAALPAFIYPPYLSSSPAFTGAILLKIENDTIQDLGRISHNDIKISNNNGGQFDFYGNSPKQIKRVYFTTDSLISVSDVAIRIHNKNNPAQISKELKLVN